MSEGIALVLDVLILSLLMATVFFAARLSVHLKTFRDSRAELQVLIGELGQNTERAEVAMAELRNSVREIESTLEGRMREAQSLSEELQFMNESADQIAGRLENAASRDSDDKSGHEPFHQEGAGMFSHDSFEDDSFEDDSFEESFSAFTDEDEIRYSEDSHVENGSGFAIRDPDLEGDSFSDLLQNTTRPREGLQSRAEQELYEALQSNRKQKTSAGGAG